MGRDPAHGADEGSPAVPVPDAASHVGVVFVHGIGTQAESATIREFAQPLIDWLAEWHRARGLTGFRVSAADLSYGGGLTGPARVVLELPAYSGHAHANPDEPLVQWPARSVVLAEAWWASRLVAPEYTRMLAWSARILGRTTGQLAGQAVLRVRALLERLAGKPGPVATSDIGQFGVFIELWGTVLLALEYVIAGVAGYLLLIVLLPLSYIPIQAVRDFILVRLVRPFLVDNVGDFETFVSDDVQALNIRRSVERAIAYLQNAEHCEAIIVAAHSQGAVVAFDALCSQGRTGFPVVSKLITFGGALNKAFLLTPDCARLQGSIPDHMFWADVWSYYDPVPGAALGGRTEEPLLVHPSDEVRRRYHWYADEGDGPQRRATVNRMNVLSDHGAYWDNWEHFTQRVAQELDQPTGYYHDSRFYNRDEKRRSQRRRARIATLVGWRLAAMYLFLLAVIARAVHGGTEQLVRDGRAMADFVAQIPGTQLLGLPGQILSAIGTAVHVVAAPLTPIPGSAGILGFLAAAVEPTQYVPLGLALLALLTVATVFAVAYTLLSYVLFHRWDAAERRASIAPTPTYRPRILLRTVVVVLPLIALGYLVSWP